LKFIMSEFEDELCLVRARLKFMSEVERYWGPVRLNLIMSKRVVE